MKQLSSYSAHSNSSRTHALPSSTHSYAPYITMLVVCLTMSINSLWGDTLTKGQELFADLHDCGNWSSNSATNFRLWTGDGESDYVDVEGTFLENWLWVCTVNVDGVKKVQLERVDATNHSSNWGWTSIFNVESGKNVLKPIEVSSSWTTCNWHSTSPIYATPSTITFDTNGSTTWDSSTKTLKAKVKVGDNPDRYLTRVMHPLGKNYSGEPIYYCDVYCIYSGVHTVDFEVYDDEDSYEAKKTYDKSINSWDFTTCWTNIQNKIYNGSSWLTFGRDITFYAIPEDATHYGFGTAFDVSTHTLYANFKYGSSGSEWTDPKPTMSKTSYKYKGNWLYKATVLATYNVVKRIQFQVYNGDSYVEQYEYDGGESGGNRLDLSDVSADDIDGKIFGGDVGGHTWYDYQRDVILDQQSGSGGTAYVTPEVGEEMPAATMPTRTGYTFKGYWTNTGGTGTEYYDEDGNSLVDWTADGPATLYAHWQINTYTVAWEVNGDTWSEGTPSTSAVYNTKVSTLPTAPTKPDCDDLKEFVGWTDASYTHATDAPTILFTTAGESPAITGNTTFYAVFAERSSTTVIWSENWYGENTDTKPSAPTSGGSKVYTSPTSITYSWSDGYSSDESKTNKTWLKTGSDAGGVAPEVMIGAKADASGTEGYITINDIPKEGTESLVLTYKQNANKLRVEVSGTGYSFSPSGTYVENSTAGAQTYTIICGTDETFDLTFKAMNSNKNVRVDDIVLTANISSYKNYSTTCAECTASPEFDEEEVAVSDIGCTGATVTATDGLSSLGTGGGCHIRNYGFVWSTSANPTTSSYTGIYTINENIDEGEEFSYDITGLNVGTRYHVRAFAQNKNGTTYTDDVTFDTDGPSSIAITTAPTKTKYIAGEKFDPTGMVVTASYPDGTTADVTEDCTLEPSTETALSDETAITVTYTSCETDFDVDQSINVYSVTITEDANPDYGSYSYTSGTTFSVTPNSEKTFGLTVTNASYRDNYDGSFTLYNPTGDITVTIDYRDAVQVKVYYKVDNITVIEQDVYESATTTLPNASAVATAMANEALEVPEDYPNFWGWSETAFTSQTSDPTIVTGTPTIHATKTYYAVFTNMNKIRIEGTDISYTSSYPTEEQTITKSSKDIKYHYARRQSGNIQFKKDKSTFGYMYNNTALTNIVKVEVGKADGKTSSIPVYAGSAANTITGSALSDAGTADDIYIYNFPSSTQYAIIKGDNSNTYDVLYIDFCYSSSTPYYMTTFCDNKVAAPTVTDSKRATAADASTVTLSWDAVSGATGYDVKWGVAGEWEDNSTNRTYSKAGVAPGTYTWFVRAQYNKASNCGANITKGSTTVNTAFEVVYDANTTDYTGDEPEGGFYEPGETVTLSSNELARSRYLWEGWAPYNGETPIDVTTNTFTMPSANVTVKGQWLVVLDKDALYVTSAKGVLTMSSMTMTITRAAITSGSVTISDEEGGQGGEFEAVITDAAADPTTGINATVKINYTPSKANVTESATMTVEIGDEDYDFTVYGRSVPADFVVAAKVGDTWLALPAIDAALSTLQGHPILVDDNADPTVASVASSVSVFNYYGKDVMANDYIRLADKTNSKALQSSTGSSADGIRVNNAIGSASGNTYEWQLATDDNVTYTIKNDAAKNGSGCYLGVSSARKWGMFNTPDTKDLRLLPVTTDATNIDMSVLRWHNKAFTFTTTSTIPSYSTINVNYGGFDYSATMSSTRPNKITISGEIDFASNPGEWLTVQWKNAGGTVIAQGAVVAPVVINSDNTNLEGVTADLGYTDVRIADGAKLTITNKDLPRLQGLYIEGGSTLFVSTTGGGAAIDFKITNLTLQGGWTNISGSRKYDMPRIYIDPKSNLSKSNSPVNFDIAVDKSNYYPIAVPFPVSVSGIDYADPYLAGFSTYGAGGQYIIKTYDGANRAEYGAVDANWTAVASDATLQPGSGYVLTAVPIGEEAVIRFPMSFTNDWTKKGEQDTVIVGKEEQVKNAVSVTHYTGAAATAKKSHEGWNILGVPYMSCYYVSGAEHSEDDAFIKGKLNFITGEYTDETNVYVNVPSHDFAEYIQSPVDEAVLLPGWCFFVQFAETGTLVYDVAGQESSSDLPIYAPKRKEAENMPTVKTGIVLSSETASDKTTFLISDKYSDEYEIGADLEKMFGNGYTLATYSLNNDTRLAFNAMSTNDAKSVIPVGIRIPADGSYTFSLNERYADADIERIDLIDYETNTITNLTAEDYTFNATRSQNDERFAINITPRAQTPTDIGDTGIDDTNGVRKILLNETIYIIRDGRVYDATGKRVTTINK